MQSVAGRGGYKALVNQDFSGLCKGKLDLRKIIDILLDFKGEKIVKYCRERLRLGADPYEIFNELSIGLDEIGAGYEGREFKRYFTSDLIVSGRNMKKAIAIVKPYFKGDLEGRGLVLVGTVKGDVHDIGKMIFAITLESNGFKTVDLGIDVDKKVFTDSVREKKPHILAMSALLSSTAPYMRDVIEELKRRQLRDKVKVIVGGRAVTEEFAKEIGADTYGKDSRDGLNKCIALMECET